MSLQTKNATSLIANCTGDHRCFYCGNPAEDELKLSSSFMGWSEVAHPESTHVCKGCIWALDQKRSIPGKAKPQKTQNYSWLITRSLKQHYTKANKTELLEWLLAPPDEPWALAIADSGNKHVIYRTPVNLGTKPYAVQLETTTIVYDPIELGDRYALAKKVVAVIGHKGAVSPTINLALSGSAELSEEWERVLHEPLTRLALFVCPSMEICKSEC